MHRFESYLINKGYIKFIFDAKSRKYKKTNHHTLSTMVNLDHRYIHESETNLLNKIKEGKSVGSGISNEDRSMEVCFGLYEVGKPPVLIHPRPRIKVKRIKEIEGVDNVVIEDERFADSISVMLQSESNDDIFKAMFDTSIVFRYDLTE